jgi:hypothetical protein
MAGEKQFDSKGSTIYVHGKGGFVEKNKFIFNGKVFWKEIWEKFLGLRYEYNN